MAYSKQSSKIALFSLFIILKKQINKHNDIISKSLVLDTLPTNPNNFKMFVFKNAVEFIKLYSWFGFKTTK